LLILITYILEASHVWPAKFVSRNPVRLEISDSSRP
jgi:hypothetical protein